MSPSSYDLVNDSLWPPPAQVVWESGVDGGAYHVKVVRLSEYRGTLTVTRKDGAELLSKEVGLSYQAIFGADADDVRDWQEEALTVIDADMKAPNG